MNRRFMSFLSYVSDKMTILSLEERVREAKKGGKRNPPKTKHLPQNRRLLPDLQKKCGFECIFTALEFLYHFGHSFLSIGKRVETQKKWNQTNEKIFIFFTIKFWQLHWNRIEWRRCALNVFTSIFIRSITFSMIWGFDTWWKTNRSIRFHVNYKWVLFFFLIDLTMGSLISR